MDDKGLKHRANVSFYVFDMTSNNIIVGLPAIIAHFHVLHKNMIDKAVSALGLAATNTKFILKKKVIYNTRHG
jgi:hypothetical protein